MAAIETPGTGSGSAPPAPRGSQQPDDTGAAPTSEAGRRTGRTPVPKLRSRKEGAAIALDDLDKRLLNLMQGQFPIAPRPYQHIAAAAGLQEAEVLTRVQRLLDERIIRQVTPIFDTRALGYASMLVAAKVDAENPWRAANIINAHPGVSHNYLRNHEFNIWFTIATEPDSPLGLEGTLEVLARLAGAESVRQLPTLKLFKIRMDLEMEAGTEALAKVAEAAPPAETEAQPYDDFDRAVIRATQGDLPVVPEPYAPAAAQLGIGVAQLAEHLRGMQERRLLRRVAAILFHRRAGFSANGMGVWKVPDERIMELGMRMASFRGISHCYERPTYADWPYSVFTMAHGRSKEECDAILDSIAADTGIDERATLYSSTEFKKIRLLYFTEDYRAWEREHAGV
jgi:siroheme decarboxylase